MNRYYDPNTNTIYSWTDALEHGLDGLVPLAENPCPVAQQGMMFDDVGMEIKDGLAYTIFVERAYTAEELELMEQLKNQQPAFE